MIPRIHFVVILCLLGGFEPAFCVPGLGIYADRDGTQCAGSTTNGVLLGSVWANSVPGITGAEFAIYCNQSWTGNVDLILFPEPGTIGFGDPLRCSRSPAELQIPESPFEGDGDVDDPPPGGWRWHRCDKCICWCGDANQDHHDDVGGGTNIAFTECQSGPRVRLFTFVLIEHVPTSDITLHIVEHSSPSNPYFCCPLVTLCDEPAFTKVCANDVENRSLPLIYYLPQAVINRTEGARCAPLTAAAPTSVQQSTWTTVKGLYR